MTASSGSLGSVIVDALSRARADGTSRIEAEHLLAALLDDPVARPLFLGYLDDPDEVEAVFAAVRWARRRGGLTRREVGSLAQVGVDLDAVVARVEAELGEGALEVSRSTARRWRVSLSSEGIAILEAAEREWQARGDRALSAKHLVIGVLSARGLVADALCSRGLTTAAVREAIDGSGPVGQ